jgi:hypothetical protein
MSLQPPSARVVAATAENEGKATFARTKTALPDMSRPPVNSDASGWHDRRDARRPSSTAVFVMMYACFRLTRMIARPDLLIARPNLGADGTIEWVAISIAKFAAWMY